MKKIITLIILVCVPLMGYCQSNRWSFYPSLGIDMGGAVPFPLKNIPKGSGGTPKLYPGLGVGCRYNLSERWDVGLEANYHILAFSATADVRSQPFYYNNHQDQLYFSGHTESDIEIRFIEFPVVAGYAINESWSFTPGFYYSRILEGSFTTSGTDGIISDNKTITDNGPLPGVANTNYNFNDNMDSWDAGLIAGFRYKLNRKVSFWSRLNIGFKSIFKKEFDNIEYEMYQVRLNAGASFNIAGR